jgi:putative oxidoreductase
MLRAGYRLRAWSIVSLRLIIGFGFMAHGFAKLTSGIDRFAGILQAVGAPAPVETAWFTALVELLGGIAIVLGAHVSLAAVPLIVIMITAILTVHLQNGFSTVKLLAVTPDGPRFGPPGYEMNLIYIAGLIALALSDPSPFSLDAWRRRRRTQ